MIDSQRDSLLQTCVFDSFMLDVEALKPGNVSRYAEGHDMQVRDFIRSAELVTPLLCDRDRSISERILDSVETTMHQVGCNTNLGMILLIAPIIFAMQHKSTDISLVSAVDESLKSLDVEKSAKIFQAIRVASPGGLGQSDKYDVHLQPEVTIIEAMQAARDRDRIAFQYVNYFKDIFELGTGTIRFAIDRWQSEKWATVSCYLVLLARYPDSHVQRKFGLKVANEVMTSAQAIEQKFHACNRPGAMTEELMEYDKKLKIKGVNPGTSADLTVASVLVYKLNKHLPA